MSGLEGVGIRCDEPEAEVDEWEVQRRTGNSYQEGGASHGGFYSRCGN